MIKTPAITPVKKCTMVVRLIDNPIADQGFLSNFKNRAVVKKAAMVPIIPCASLSRLFGIKFLANDKTTKMPVKTAQNRTDFKIYPVLILF